MQRVLVSLVLCSLLPSSGEAHSWYPSECCSGQDCAPMIRMDRLPNGDYLYVTPQASAIINSQTSIRDSKDHRIHVCIRNGKMLCLFFPPFN